MTDPLPNDTPTGSATPAPELDPPTFPEAAQLAGEVPAAPPGTSSTPPRATRPNVFARFVNWFWRGREIAELARNSVPVPAHSRELHRRALLTAELARLALEPPHPLRHGSGEAVACELYRQSVFWTLGALSIANGGPPAAHTETLPALWQRTDPALLLQAAADPDALSEVEAALTAASFVDFAELDADRQRSLAWDLRRFVDALLTTLDRRQALLDRLRLQRLVRVSLVVLLLLFLAPGVLLFHSWQEKRDDLARNRPWKASSEQMQACDSPAQNCEQTRGFFFHTQDEENPWLMIDLGGKYPVKRVQVLNRTDCCPERAVPLVIEVSTNKKSWKVVAQRSESFRTWDATFASAEARHVRVRSLRRTMLHLAGVRVYR